MGIPLNGYWISQGISVLIVLGALVMGAFMWYLARYPDQARAWALRRQLELQARVGPPKSASSTSGATAAPGLQGPLMPSQEPSVNPTVNRFGVPLKVRKASKKSKSSKLPNRPYAFNGFSHVHGYQSLSSEYGRKSSTAKEQ